MYLIPKGTIIFPFIENPPGSITDLFIELPINCNPRYYAFEDPTLFGRRTTRDWRIHDYISVNICGFKSLYNKNIGYGVAVFFNDWKDKYVGFIVNKYVLLAIVK